MKILFRSHLSGKAEDWYDDLEIEEKGWLTLTNLETCNQLTPRDIRIKLFDLKMNLANLKQQTEESIADYHERAANLVTKFATEDFDIDIVTMRGINDRERLEWIERDCHWTEDLRLLQSASLLRFHTLNWPAWSI